MWFSSLALHWVSNTCCGLWSWAHLGSSPSSSPRQLCSLEHVVEPQYSVNAEGWKPPFFDFPVCMCVFLLVTQSYVTLCDPMDCILPGSSVHEILQARILEWVVIPFSRGSSWPRDRTCISCIGRWILLPLSHRGSPKIYYLCLNAQIPALRVQCFKTMAQLEENTVT